ncbi:MAG: hypothetical protein GY869_09555, partial [Planctomycetes bacterium]|nr:hypothetical protein [Planctomycetota bacterium]
YTEEDESYVCNNGGVASCIAVWGASDFLPAQLAPREQAPPQLHIGDAINFDPPVDDVINSTPIEYTEYSQEFMVDYAHDSLTDVSVNWKYVNDEPFDADMFSQPDYSGPIRNCERWAVESGSDTDYYANTNQYGPYSDWSQNKHHIGGEYPDFGDPGILSFRRTPKLRPAGKNHACYQNVAEHILHDNNAWILPIDPETDWGIEYIDNWLDVHGDERNPHDPDVYFIDCW